MNDKLSVSIETIKVLRERTSAGVMDCKRALQEADGDMEKAEVILKALGVASAEKKASRATNQGLVESYVHSGGRIAAIVEVNCETDFVARTEEFKSLAHDLAMQVAAMSPQYVDRADIPEDEEVTPDQVCLMQQPFIKDPSKSIDERVKEAIGVLGENVRVRRFSRFALGE
jgi:elongation factor Ts